MWLKIQCFIKGKEKDTPMDEADSGTNEKGANGAFDGAGGSRAKLKFGQ